MRKIFASLLFVAVMFGVAGLGNAVDLNSSVVSAFNVAVTTGSSTGKIVADTVAKVRIAKITVSYDVSATTGSVRLYDNNKGTSSTLLWSVQLPSGTSLSPDVIQESFDMGMPMVAHNGLIAVADGGRAILMSISYW
jgi:hypothetical protein